MILLKANDKLKVVFHKIIKTMNENVQWNELFIIHNNDLILLGRLRSLFFNFDNKRAFSNIIDITVNEETAHIITENEMLENAINMTLYTFGKWGSIKGLKVEKDYDQLNHLLNYILRDVKVEASLTRDNLRFFKSGTQMTYEEVIQMILDYKEEIEEVTEEKTTDSSEEKEEEYSLGLWHKVVWKRKSFSFGKSEITNEDKNKSRLGNQFYMVNYQCPTCKEKLHMVVYPKGKEFRIETQDEAVYLARAYTCNQCNSYFTPIPLQLLAEGEVYYLNFEDDKVAYEDYQELLGKKGERIANSNFNQYESDYLKGEEEQEEEKTPTLEEFDDYESMTQEELNALLEKLESGFYSEEIVARYKDAIKKELKKKKDEAREKKSSKEEVSQETEKEIDKKKVEKGRFDRAKIKGNITTDSKKNLSDWKKSNAIDKVKDHFLDKESSNKNESISHSPLNKTSSKIDQSSTLSEKGLMYGSKEDNSFTLSDEMYTKFTDLMKKGEINEIEHQLSNLSKSQLLSLKDRLHSEDGLEEKTKVIQMIDTNLSSKVEEEARNKARDCKDKSYAHVQQVMDEIKKMHMKEETKNSILDSLSDLLHRKAKNELENILSKVPANLNKLQYEQFKDKIKEYKSVDTKLYTKLLDEKFDDVQKTEIASFMKRANPRNRAAYLDTYEQLKAMGYEERNVSPTLEKLRNRIYEMDEKAIYGICGEPADLSFDEGVKAYEEILLGEYLPELKEDALRQIDARLTKLKVEECEQLVNKLIKEISPYINNVNRIYFNNPRKMLRPNYEDATTTIIQNAVKAYGTKKEKYEYPILVCDTSHAQNGESGFFLTPNHVFYRSLLDGGKIDVMDIEEVYAKKSVLSKGIFIKTKHDTVKITNSLQIKDLNPIATVLQEFISYLKDKPESRNISYLAKEVHTVKCCYRCGYVYKKGNICPKCGSKMND